MKTFLRKHFLPLILLIVLSLPLTQQAFHNGFFVADDGEWMIIRSSAFHEALNDGQFPVRYLGRLLYEYGYPVPTFLYPAYLYLVEPLYLLDLGYIKTITIFFTITMVLSGIFAYFWLRKLFDTWAALVGALVYLYTPYHLVDMYRRGSLGELLALTVVPFILWQIERRSLVFSSVGIALLILSHNIMAAMFLPVIFIYSFLSYFHQKSSSRRKSGSKGSSNSMSADAIVNAPGFRVRPGMTNDLKLIEIIVPFLFGLGLAAFFWIPALFELQYTVFSQVKMFDWRQHFAPYATIGGLQLVLLFTGVLVLFTKLFNTLIRFKKMNHEFFTAVRDSGQARMTINKAMLVLLFVLIGLVSVYFSSRYSSPLWTILPVTFIQFPFRFLSLEILSVAFLAAYILSLVQQRIFKLLFAVVICIALAINALPYLKDIQYYDKGDSFYTSNLGSTTTGDEYTPVWVKEKPKFPPERLVDVIQGAGTVSNLSANNKHISFAVDSKTDSVVQINKIYWPGWTAAIDGGDVPIKHDNKQGIMNLNVPEGKHAVSLTFHETPLRLFADGLSILSLLGLIATLVFKRKPKKK